MKQIRNTITAIILTTSLAGCGSSSGIESEKSMTSQSPEEFGQQFTSVCKVGVKGGDGTLIEKNWVLTAGHVAKGMYERSSGELSVYFENGSEYKVQQVFLHPKYQHMGKYDLALLKLESNVSKIDPVQIYTDKDELNQLITIAGHGDKRGADNSWITDGKLRAYTNIIDEVDDTHIIFDYDSPDNDPTEREGTSGPGDSGGPAFIRKVDITYLAGVSSMGEPGSEGPATFGAIEYFVRVSMFQDWINDTMKNPDSNKAISTDEIAEKIIDEPIQWSDSEQARSAKLFLTTLENYSKQKMIDAISRSFDPVKLEKRSPEKIIDAMPALIKELKGAKLVAIRSESAEKMSFELSNNNIIYGMDIFFSPTSKKIEQIGFGKFD